MPSAPASRAVSTEPSSHAETRTQGEHDVPAVVGHHGMQTLRPYGAVFLVDHNHVGTGGRQSLSGHRRRDEVEEPAQRIRPASQTLPHARHDTLPVLHAGGCDHALSMDRMSRSMDTSPTTEVAAQTNASAWDSSLLTPRLATLLDAYGLRSSP
jgi:hypothetical protein